jgi:uncharacterized protein (TIGR03437 family)
LRAAAGLAGFACLLTAQTPSGAGDVSWKRVGGTAINRGLAGPASGPLSAIWYNTAGSVLFVRTAAGRLFDTTDFEHWRLNTTSTAPPARAEATAASAPEPGARVQSAGDRLYALGHDNVYGSEDRGGTWLNLTGYNGRSIIGDNFSALAISPSDPKDVSSANQYGVWRSLDGGLSWRSLNEGLPNLPIRRLTGRRSVLLDDNSQATLEGGVWTPVGKPDDEAVLMARAARTGLRISAAAHAVDIDYAGTADGRLFTSRDAGNTWSEAPQTTGAPVGRIWVDADRPQSALATAGFRIYRTVNGGLFWDDVTGGLPDTRVHALTADRSAGVVYAATDRGILSASLSLDSAGPPASNWRSISRNLPSAAAWDIRLNPDNTLTAALDGYGVYETQAPHRSRAIHLLNAADLSDRPAAPGSLLTLLNADVAQAASEAQAYPVIAASAQSSQLQVPFDAAPGAYQLALSGTDGRWTVPLNIRDVAPAIFVDSEGAPLILDSSTGLVMDPNTAVRAGSSVAVLATGLGKVSPEWPAGKPAPLDAPPVVSGTVMAYLDGIPVEVTRAALAPGYVGYYLVELRIPPIVNRGVSGLRLVMNGEASNDVRFYIEP